MKLEEIINNNLTETLKINDISVIDTKFTHGLEVASELLIDTFQKKACTHIELMHIKFYCVFFN